jgi:hypothetical protein
MLAAGVNALGYFLFKPNRPAATPEFTLYKPAQF